MIKETVIIDGAVPRSPRERVEALLDYWQSISPIARMIGQTKRRMLDKAIWPDGDAIEEWDEIEAVIISSIAMIVGEHGFDVIMGEHCPGDVCIVKQEEEIPFDDEGRYVTVEGLEPGWRIDKADGQMYYSDLWL